MCVKNFFVISATFSPLSSFFYSKEKMTYWGSLLKLKIPVTKDPRNLPVWRKRLLLGLVCFIAIIPGFCSTIYVCIFLFSLIVVVDQ